MGLDVSAYSGIKLLDATVNEDGEAIDNASGEEMSFIKWFSPWINPAFPGRADDIQDGAVYSYDDCTGHGVGYGGHYWWRDKLAEISGYPLTEFTQYGRVDKNHFHGCLASESGPFYELINFSDCEGVIGASVSKKLAADFAEFDSRAQLEDGKFYKQYLEWKAAFEMASKNGCVLFH